MFKRGQITAEYMKCNVVEVDNFRVFKSRLKLYISFPINNSRRKFKRNQYLIRIQKSEEDYSQILLTLISIFSQNMDEFEKQVQTLESVHPLISKYRQTG